MEELAPDFGARFVAGTGALFAIVVLALVVYAAFCVVAFMMGE